SRALFRISEIHMTDPRMEKLADVLINYSCAVRPGEKVLLEAIDMPHEFTTAVVRAAYAAKARPFVLLKSNIVDRALRLGADSAQFETMADIERGQMEKMDCYIGARGNHNISEMSDVPRDRQQIFERTIWKRVHHEVRIKKTRWVVMRWPHPSMAQMAE